MGQNLSRQINSGGVSMLVCLTKTGVLLGLIIFLIKTVELHYILESSGVFHHCYSDYTQSLFTFEVQAIYSDENLVV